MYELKHYGTPRRSGRYPWGSGDDPQQHNKSIVGRANELKKQGLSDVEIARNLGLTTTQLRIKRSLEKSQQKENDVALVIKLKDKGMSNVEIGKRMGIPESSVRNLLNPVLQERAKIADTTAKMLKARVDEKGYIDVGVGSERYLGITRTKLKTSLALLEEEGYKIHYLQVKQLGTGKNTSLMALSKPDITYSEVSKNRDKIAMVTEQHSMDGGRSYLGLKPIQSVDSKRVMIRYHEDGGSDKDGVVELRRNVDDISLGNSKYAQVRIGVDGTHYLKGMAMYADTMPPGVDIIYNTNKKKGTPKEKVFKEMKRLPDGSVDTDNPFGATIKAGGQRKAINIVNEEGDWSKWSKTISSQMLSKQTPALAKKQLDLAYAFKKDEYAEIMSLTNPVVKRKLLESFASDCDSAAVHLKAAALPRQGAHAILPITTMKDTEIYAPNYRNGERVVLIRYPHGGIFEIPELTVNNKQPEANRVMKNAKDAVGISAKVAERLSGADFDGDTVLVIPNSPSINIKTSAPLKGLKDFDPKASYPAYEGMIPITPKAKQMKMGDVSNLITDMTIRGANGDELARAVRHSMVVIDSEKHNLNYKKSYIDNGIAGLKKKYQGSERSGASTLISKASSETRVGVRKEKIDPATGKKIYEYTGETYVNGKGRTVLKTTPSTKMYEVDDAFKLSSGTIMEDVYATHANNLKVLANVSRREAIRTTPIEYSPTAKQTYAHEVSSLNAKLNIALKNSPLERQAQLLANNIVATKKAERPKMDSSEIKRLKEQALTEARIRTGAKKQRIDITDKEWQAIQAGAISTNNLSQILNNTDLDRVKQLATPRAAKAIPLAKKQTALRMLKAGHTQSEVADALNLPTSVVAELN